MIGTTLQKLLEEKGSNVNELSRQINVSAQTLYSIIKRDNMKVDFEVLLKICDALSVPVEFFYNDYVDSRYRKVSSFTKEEEGYIEKYRTLDEHGKRLVNLVLSEEIERCQSDHKPMCQWSSEFVADSEHDEIEAVIRAEEAKTSLIPSLPGTHGKLKING